MIYIVFVYFKKPSIQLQIVCQTRFGDRKGFVSSFDSRASTEGCSQKQAWPVQESISVLHCILLYFTAFFCIIHEKTLYLHSESKIGLD
jgi:hypothetical protein